MDPNNNQLNNQQINGQQLNGVQQKTPQVSQAPQSPVGQPIAQQDVQYQNPQGKSHKTILLLLILLIVVLGLAAYLVYANMNTNAPEAIPAPTVQVVPPTNTPTPTIAEDDFTVDDPEVDIKILDDAAATL